MLYLLERDLDLMGFPPYWLNEAENSYDRFWSVLQATSKTDKTHIDAEKFQEETLVTDFGRTLLHLMRGNVHFKPAGLACCQNTEPLLRRTLLGRKDPSIYADRPLLLVTDGPDIIAVQKNIGDPSIYPLADRPHMGLFVGTVAAPIRYIRPALVDGYPEDVVKVSADEYRGFVPKRMASTAIDEYIRHSLETTLTGMRNFTRKGLSMSHDDIMAAVAKKADCATDFRPSMLIEEAVD